MTLIEEPVEFKQKRASFSTLPRVNAKQMQAKANLHSTILSSISSLESLLQCLDLPSATSKLLDGTGFNCLQRGDHLPGVAQFQISGSLFIRC